MHLDVVTLMVAEAFVAQLSAALLLYTWFQYRETNVALWWAGAAFVTAIALILIAVGGSDNEPRVFQAGIGILLFAPALTWGGARAFDGEPIGIGPLIAGMVLWILASALIPSFDTGVTSAVLNAAIVLTYLVAAAYSLYHGRKEPLHARLPLAILITVHALTFSLSVPAAFTNSLRPNEIPPIMSLFGIVHFETIIFLIGTTLFLVAITKERSELRYAAASLTDPLTGLLNRRGFFSAAARIFERTRRNGEPVCVMAVDLDRFKDINDRFGHAIGDRTLQVFAETYTRSLRPGDVMGRVGGEEFAVICPGITAEVGYAMAERLRRAFAEAARTVDGNTVEATVSVGIAVDDYPYDIHELLLQADQALYRAKRHGKNRVERNGSDRHSDDNIVRIA